MKKNSLGFAILGLVLLSGCLNKYYGLDASGLNMKQKSLLKEILTTEVCYCNKTRTAYASLTSPKDSCKKTILMGKFLINGIQKGQDHFSVLKQWNQIEKQVPYGFDLKGAAFKGNAKATVVLIEFTDFECPFCKKIQETLAELIAFYKGKVKLVFKHFPLPYHKYAFSAAKAAICAGNQGKFWEMHDLIYQNQEQLTENIFIEFAKRLKLNIKQFESDFLSRPVSQQVKKDHLEGENAGVMGTPTFFLNGIRILENEKKDQEGFTREIDKLLQKK